MTTTIYAGIDPTSHSGYTTSQEDGGNDYAAAFTVAKIGTLKRIGYFSPPGTLTALPTTIGLFEESNTTPVVQATPTWSGAHGSGWIWASVPDTTLVAGKTYFAVIATTASFDQAFIYQGDVLIPATSSDENLSAPDTLTDPAGPAHPYNNGNGFAYPDTAPPGPLNWLVDVEVDFGVFTVTEGNTTGGVTTYSVDATINNTDNSGPQNMRVLTPDSPAEGRPHAFLWMLPVEPGQGSAFGDAISTAKTLGIHNTYNLTCIQPEFPLDPWYGNSVSDPETQQETFILSLVDWAKANIAPDGTEKHYLIGFSKSGFGGQVLFLRHQDVFEAVASWDIAGDYVTLDQYDGEPIFGSQDNLDNYALFDPNLATWKADGDTGTVNRIWLGAGIDLITQTESYSDRLTNDEIQHTYRFVETDAHSWAPNPGWVAPAVAAMLGSTPPSPTADASMSFTIT